MQGTLISRFPLWSTTGKFYWESQSLAEGSLWGIKFLALLHVGCKMKSAQAEGCRACIIYSGKALGKQKQ